MKTIEDAAQEYAESKANPIFRRLEVSIAKSAFKAGAEFAQQMTSFDEEKPEYYTPVIIEYESNEYIAWLAWSETNGYIWTINGTDVVLIHKPNIKWRYINIK